MQFAGPEIERLVNEFDEHNDRHNGKHHEHSAAVLAGFRKDVCEVTGIVHRMDSSVVQTLKTAETIGQVQYDAFVQERLVLCEKLLTDTIPKNNLSLFGTPP